MSLAVKQGRANLAKKVATGIRKEVPENKAEIADAAEVSLLWPPYPGNFRDVSISDTFGCAIYGDGQGPSKSRRLTCWGVKAPLYFDFDRNVVKFSRVSVSQYYGCGVTALDTVLCFPGSDGMWKLKYMQALPPPNTKWSIEPSCGTSHPTISGPASCTSCSQDSCNKHFTVVDPKTNTGTCTKAECPFCKPQSCCGKHHKHYVLNTETQEGICVRMNDDCTPACVPQGVNDPTQIRVCSKGCNMMTKAMKNPKAKSEEEMYDMVVCQAHKKVVCNPKTGNNGSCTTTAEIKPVAVCKFSSEVWNLGGTCIANRLHQNSSPQCPTEAKVSTLAKVKKICRMPAANGGSEAAKEAAMCERLGMSF